VGFIDRNSAASTRPRVRSLNATWIDSTSLCDEQFVREALEFLGS
jgi:hypothetical protein